MIQHINRAALMLAAIGASTCAHSLTFHLSQVAGDFSGSTGAAALAGFDTAAARWSSLFADNITINLQIGFHDLGSTSIIGSTGSAQSSASYASVRSALINDVNSSSVDNTVRNNLPAALTGSNQFVINHPGAGSTTPQQYTPASIGFTRANGKALGLIAANSATQDASITFNSTFGFSFDPNNVGSSQIDFVGVATHEIGHALGFISSSDDVDGSASSSNTGFAPTVLDLFRYSSDSGFGVSRDITADTRTKFFSLDGGATNDQGGTFSQGVSHGDGRQGSHWKDLTPSIGIMDPTAGFGQTLAISQLDIDAFDAIGYNRAAVTPEPASLVGLCLGALLLIRRRKSAK
jgi:hypothetical protein